MDFHLVTTRLGLEQENQEKPPVRCKPAESVPEIEGGVVKLKETCPCSDHEFRTI